jgi:hypothetical protein
MSRPPVRCALRAALSLVALLSFAPSPAAAEPPGTVLVSTGSAWRYLDDGSNAGSAWRAPAFADGAWAQGAAQLGYGDGDEATVVNGGPAGAHFITTYFRRHFTVMDAVSIQALKLRLLRDDGAVVYLNGTEVARSNMPSGSIGHTTRASLGVGAAGENTFYEFSACASLLVTGDNVLAVEVHQSGPASSDVSFEASLEVIAASPVTLVRAPYLQDGTPTSTVLRWRTSQGTDSRVRFGAEPGSLTQSVQVAGCRTEHEVAVSGLSPATRYYYDVGTSTQTLAGDDADHSLQTLPVAGTRRPIRIWVIGDSGSCAAAAQGCIDAANVRDAYLAFAGAQRADVWLLLGDNAYNTGTDTEFTTGFFGVYPTVMRDHFMWSAIGNHEAGAADSPTQSGPYYDSFTFPRAGEAGGIPSGTEAYYSFDYGSVHFVALDSQDTDRSAPADPEADVCAVGQGGAMYQWLCADLAASDQDFSIGFFHHPPYTKGSHNSDNVVDSGARMEEMRSRFLPVLESYGVDLVLTGHSHSYERSILLDGQYATSDAYQPLVNGVDTGDGDPAGDGPYAKSAIGPGSHGGAVYSVVGSSSQTGGGLLNHPVMTTSLNVLGSLVIDVVGNQLDARFLDDDGSTRDRFRIVKGPTLPVCSNGIDDDGDGLLDFPADPGCLSATDLSEVPDCEDGLDNDGDGKIDLSGANPDPGCVGLVQMNKEAPQCDDHADNDGDGATDFPADTLCAGSWDDDEASNPPPAPACGLLGIEPLLLAAYGFRRTRTAYGFRRTRAARVRA